VATQWSRARSGLLLMTPTVSATHLQLLFFRKDPYGRLKGDSGRIVKVLGSCKSLVRLTSSREQMRRNRSRPGCEKYSRSQAGSVSSTESQGRHVTEFGFSKLWLLVNQELYPGEQLDPLCLVQVGGTFCAHVIGDLLSGPSDKELFLFRLS
jgi:hypothetical protein